MSSSRFMKLQGARLIRKHEWRRLAPAIVSVVLLVSILLETRFSTRAASFEALKVSEKALEVALAGHTAPKFIAHAGDAPPRVHAIDFGCATPKNMRLSANCWKPASSGVYTGSKVMKSGSRRIYLEDGNSQFAEDLILLENFFFDVRGGTFLEMGALDGLKFSNTFFFEKYLDWTGIMIDGSPSHFKKLVVNRPGVIAVNAMMCSSPRSLHWIEGRTSDAVGGCWELMTEFFKKRYYPSVTDDDVEGLPTVPCVSLTDVLARFGVWHVDIFSLDVEGAEASVLKTLDFTKFAASVIVLEVRPGSRALDMEAYNILRSHGYVDFGYYGFTYPNRFMLHPKFNATRRHAKVHLHKGPLSSD